jgi:hypothetical protein
VEPIVILPEEYPEAVADAGRLLGEGADFEAVLRLLKARGCSPIDSIRAVMELTGWRLAEATRKVHFSETWRELQD